MDQVRVGHLRGTGAAINVPIGWIPDTVIVENLTDGDKIHIGSPSTRAMPFTSGGTTEITRGVVITGATSGATARVRDVILDSGTWAGGDAAGWLFIDEESKVGTFTSENVYVPGGTNDATVTVDVTYTSDIDTEVATATGNNAISAYLGTATIAKGFTLGSTISEDAKLLKFTAMRSGPGAVGRSSTNSL